MIGYTLLLTILFSIISEIIIRFQKRKITPRWKIFQHPWIYWPVIFLCWLPCYLAYYPGIISYDMHEQMAQAFGTVSYSKYHPPLHTFVWDMCLTIEKLTGFSGLVIYSILQMLLLSFAFTYMLRFFIKKNVGNILVLLTLLFVCFNPVIAIFSFIPVKDALFTVFFILYCVELCDFICNKEAYSHNYFSVGRMILFSVLCCLLRNNIVYGLLVATIFMLLSLKKYWKNILVWNAIIIAIYGIINGHFYSMLGIKDGNSREMLSVPIQQITYVVTHYDGAISEDTIQRIDKYLPYEELPHLYNPRLADYAKVNFNTSNFEKDKGGFLKLWFDLFKEYPDEYLVAFLNLNLPYWYVNANSVDEYAKRDYIETYIMEPSVTNYEVVRDSKIPWLYEEYEMYAEYEFKNDSPIVKRFFSINTPI